jgi:hypothetical protein
MATTILGTLNPRRGRLFPACELYSLEPYETRLDKAGYRLALFQFP